VEPQLLVAIQTTGINNLPSLSSSELNQLEQIIDVDVPQMRRLAAPAKESMFSRLFGAKETE
jgi:hypothetical protein